MSSLGRHLATPAPHGQLPFHPSCPVCCEARLHGSLPDGPIVPARVKATLATALVTASTAGAVPGGATAQEADEQMEGTELPQQRPEQAPDPGEETRVPDDESVPVPDVTGGDTDDDSEGAPLESEPQVPGSPPDTPDAPPAPIPPAPEDEGSPVPAPERIPTAERPTADDRQPKDGPRPESAPPRSGTKPSSSPSHPAPTTNAPQTPVPLPHAEPPSLATDGAQQPAGADTVQDRIAPGGKAERTVRPGESLWSIAADLAGPDATAGEIARIVNRLWTLNADRIGTGDPDLVMAGTTLRTR